MDLNEFAIGVESALLIERRLRRPRTYNGVGRLAEDRAISAGSDNDSVGREGAHFHRSQIHGADATADTISVEHCRQKFPVFVLLYLAFGFVAPDLFVKRVEKLLPRSRAGKRRPVI